MLFHRLKLTALTLVSLGAVAASGVWAADKPNDPRRGQQTPIAAHPDDASTKAALGGMSVVGRVLDPQGKPVPGAKVMVSARPRMSQTNSVEGLALEEIGRGGADQSGRFRFDAARTSSSRNDDVMIVALAPGYGVGWVKVDPDADEPEGDIALEPEQVLEGRLFDVYGRPAQGVVVSVYAVERKFADIIGSPVRLRLTSEGPHHWWARINDLPAWPKPATTDAKGRFTVHGVGRGRTARLSVIDPRFARDLFEVDTDDAPGAKSISRALQPAKIITGRITYADTGKPAAHAQISIGASGAGQQGTRPTYFEADADGRFRANPSPGDRFVVGAKPPAGQRYLRASKRVDWPKGAVEQAVDIALARGVTVRGTVIDEGSDDRIAGALVNFRSRSLLNTESVGGFSESVTAIDGTFELAVLPGAGLLAVKAADENYVLRAITFGELTNGQPGGPLVFSHGFVGCDPKPSGPVLEVRIALRRGVTVKGCIIGPDGQPVRGTWIISGVVFPPGTGAYRSWGVYYHAESPTGRFELHGLDPGSEETVYFVEPKRRLGATVRVSGKRAADELLTVRLEPCGSATARLVDASGQPRGGYRNEALTAMLIAPGPELATRNRATRTGGSERSIPLIVIDPINYPEAPLSDARGRITFQALIPGARYRITERIGSGARQHKDFTVKPGETLNRGDILIERP